MDLEGISGRAYTREEIGKITIGDQMIKDAEMLAQFEKGFLKEKGRIPFAQAMKLFAAMWREATTFEIFPPKEPMEGIDVDIKIARVLNSCSKKSFPD